MYTFFFFIKIITEEQKNIVARAEFSIIGENTVEVPIGIVAYKKVAAIARYSFLKN